VLFRSNLGGAIFVFHNGGDKNITISGNNCTEGGIVLISLNIEEDTFIVDETNTVNDEKFYYYLNKPNLDPSNFTDAGQIYLINSSNCLISDLDLSNVSLGLFLYQSNNTIIKNITCTNNNVFGIAMIKSKDNNLSNCILNNNQYGMITLLASTNNFSLIDYNDNNVGIYMQNSTNNIISNNSFNFNEITNPSLDFFSLGGGYGLLIDNDCDHNNISNNIIKGNDKYGIHLQRDSDNNTIQNNRIIDNIEFGIFISRYEYEYPEDNKVYHNNFLNNYIDAVDNSINNAWDDGNAGNFWDDYLGEDTNPEDGIGDFPFLINGTAENFDTYPLIYLTYEDTDGDGLDNYEEYIPGIDNDRTNVTNPDSDYDGLSDYWEWLNSTEAWNPDSDGDNMPDGWEVFNLLNPTYEFDNLTDADTDLLLNVYEYTNGTNPQDPDTDGDALLDGEEILGTLGYITNATNPDTDNDGLWDSYEYGNNTLPLDPDTDGDTLLDGEEILGILGYITNATNPDTDNDGLWDNYEYGNKTIPINPDTDGDSFNDYRELVLYHTDPINRWWYPMPNLAVVNFKATTAEIGKPFVLNFTIINNGIWEAEDVEIIVRIEYLGITLYNNSENPIDLGVDETYLVLFTSSQVSTGGDLVMELILDPNNLINETYSDKSGSLENNGEEDNSFSTILEITGDLPGDGGEGLDPFLLILIIVGVVAVAVVSIISIFLILRPKIKKQSIHKKQLEIAIKDIENFESNLKNFIKVKLQGNYQSEWWGIGIPEYIRETLGIKMQTIKSSKSSKPGKPKAQIDPMDALDLTDYSSIITYNENWEQIFSTIFPNKNMVETNLMNLSVFKKGISQNIITSEQLSAYPLFINNIRSYFTQEFNVFLSYSTLDTKHFNIREIAKRLQTYPKINKVFFWEEDSGENIVTYMERTLKMTKVFVFFCTQHSVKSRAVEDEWQAAFQMRKKGLLKIVPVYENEELIPYLLMPLLNVKFTIDDFDGFIQKLYEEIIR
ncbi:MAG: NosD domain-containing protein, partial [Candidatus Odinarchaeota archaeon]